MLHIADDTEGIAKSVGYWGEADKPTETAYWEYWLEAIEKFKKDGPPL